MAEARRLSTRDAGFEAELARLLAFEAAQDEGVERATAGILDAVRARGDAALIEYTERFDRWKPASAQALQVPLAQARAALQGLAAREREALEFAAARIRAYHEHQVQDSWRKDGGDGTVLGQQVTPLDRVGLYVPGGKAAYPSSVLMSAVAAKGAGVPELVMVTPTPGGDLNTSVLAARSSSCATSTRRASSPTRSPPSTSSSPWPIPRRSWERSGTRAPSSSAITPRNRWAITARVPTTCCRPRAPRASPRRSASTISRSARASSGSPRPPRAGWGARRPRSRAPKGWRRMRGAPSGG